MRHVESTTLPSAASDNSAESVARDLRRCTATSSTLAARLTAWFLGFMAGDRSGDPADAAADLLSDAPEGTALGLPPTLHANLLLAGGLEPAVAQLVDGGDELLVEPDDGEARLLPLAARLPGAYEIWDAPPFGIWCRDRLLCGGSVVLRVASAAESSPRVVWLMQGGQWVPHPDVRWPGEAPAWVRAGPAAVLGVILGVLRALAPRSEVQLGVLMLELVAPIFVPTRVVREVEDLEREAVPPFALHAGVQLLPWPAQASLVAAWRIAQWVDEAFIHRTIPGWESGDPSWDGATEGAQNLVRLCALQGLVPPEDGAPPVAAICGLLREVLITRLSTEDGFGVSSLRDTLRNSAAIGRLIDPGEDTLLAACAWVMEQLLECPRPAGRGGRYSDVVGRLSDRMKNARSAAGFSAICEEILRRFGDV
jgi:hypothetical protein